MKPRDQAIKFLNENGYFFKMHGANHDQYYSEVTRAKIPLKRHDFNENDLRYIQKEVKKLNERLGR